MLDLAKRSLTSKMSDLAQRSLTSKMSDPAYLRALFCVFACLRALFCVCLSEGSSLHVCLSEGSILCVCPSEGLALYVCLSEGSALCICLSICGQRPSTRGAQTVPTQSRCWPAWCCWRSPPSCGRRSSTCPAHAARSGSMAGTSLSPPAVSAASSAALGTLTRVLSPTLASCHLE